MASTSEDFFAAIEAGDADRVRALVEADPSLATSRDAEGVSALMRARYRFDDAIVDAIRPRVPELDLFEAATFGDVPRLEELLSNGPASVAAMSGDGFTALHLAAFFGHADAARLLLRHGADLDAPGTGWMTGTALHSAVSARHEDVVAALLEAGADPNVRQSGGWTPLHSAAHNGDLRILTRLLEAGSDPSAVNDDGTTARAMAEATGDLASVAAIEAAVDGR
ncbi:MAG TPA: ankyrin repeat domain-containing protein [Actinomycetota bacterium]